MPEKDNNLSICRDDLSNISHNRPRNVYHQKTHMQFMCRVCLTRSNALMYDLSDNSILLEDNLSKTNIISIHEALEKVTASKIRLYGYSPRYICPVCFSILKMSLKFIYQFEESYNKLKDMVGDINLQNCETRFQYEVVNDHKPDNNNSAPVELIYGENKYSLEDLLVVEKTEEENYNFNGFLNNLGKEVIATFADNSDRPHLEDTGGQVTISLVGKDKVLPVKELQLDEDTNIIKCVLVENEDSDTEEEILKLEIEGNDDNDTNQSINRNVNDINIDAFIIENGIEKMDSKSVNLRQKFAQMQNNSKKSEYNVHDDILNKEVHPCDICRKVFDFPDRLKAHKRRIHSNQTRVYNCDICGYKNKTLSGHKYHKTKHTGKRWFCEVCKKCYYTKSALKVHMETHSNKRQHRCTVCGKGFNYSNALIYHMRLHTGEKNYICKYCGQKFRMSHSLNRHVRTHTGERPYQCRYCDKALRSKGELNCHESAHTGVRPYHCKYCGKGFSKTHNLKLHLLSHGGPNKCELCRRNFIEPSILTMHYKISHKDVEKRTTTIEEDSD